MNTNLPELFFIRQKCILMNMNMNMIRQGQSCKFTRFSHMASFSSSLSGRLISSKQRKAYKQQLKTDYAATRAHKPREDASASTWAQTRVLTQREQLVKPKTRLNQQMQGGSSLTRQLDDNVNWRHMFTNKNPGFDLDFQAWNHPQVLR